MLKVNIEKIEKERRRLGWTKTKLAHEAGISKQALNYIYSSGSLSRVELIAKAFGIEPIHLITTT